MKVLFSCPGLSYQADAPFSNPLRARSMQSAGMDVTLFGFPVEWPMKGSRLSGLRYRSLQGMSSFPFLKWKKRLGKLWLFILEPLLVKLFSFKLAREGKFDVLFCSHTESWILLVLIVLRIVDIKRVRVVARISNVFYSRNAMHGRPWSSRVRGFRILPRYITVVFDTRFMPRAMKMVWNSNIKIIQEGYLWRKSDPDRQRNAREKLGIALDQHVLLLFGVASHAKGSQLLFETLWGFPTLCDVYSALEIPNIFRCRRHGCAEKWSR